MNVNITLIQPWRRWPAGTVLSVPRGIDKVFLQRGLIAPPGVVVERAEADPVDDPGTEARILPTKRKGRR